MRILIVVLTVLCSFYVSADIVDLAGTFEANGSGKQKIAIIQRPNSIGTYVVLLIEENQKKLSMFYGERMDESTLGLMSIQRDTANENLVVVPEPIGTLHLVPSKSGQDVVLNPLPKDPDFVALTFSKKLDDVKVQLDLPSGRYEYKEILIDLRSTSALSGRLSGKLLNGDNNLEFTVRKEQTALSGLRKITLGANFERPDSRKVDGVIFSYMVGNKSFVGISFFERGSTYSLRLFKKKD